MERRKRERWKGEGEREVGEMEVYLKINIYQIVLELYDTFAKKQAPNSKTKNSSGLETAFFDSC